MRHSADLDGITTMFTYSFIDEELEAAREFRTGATLICADPPVIYTNTNVFHVEIPGISTDKTAVPVLSALNEVLRVQAHFLLQTWWSCHDPILRMQYKAQIQDFLKLYPKSDVTFLTNTEDDANLLLDNGLKSQFIHQNGFVN